jgi:hypothetical protein
MYDISWFELFVHMANCPQMDGPYMLVMKSGWHLMTNFVDAKHAKPCLLSLGIGLHTHTDKKLINYIKNLTNLLEWMKRNL